MATLKLKRDTTSARLTQIRESRKGTPSCDDWMEEAKAVLQNLGGIFPAVFDPRDRKPLALNIHEELIQETDYSPVAIKSALRWWTGHGGYLEAVAKGGSRYNLEGEQAQQVIPHHQEHAAAIIQERKRRVVEVTK